MNGSVPNSDFVQGTVYQKLCESDGTTNTVAQYYWVKIQNGAIRTIAIMNPQVGEHQLAIAVLDAALATGKPVWYLNRSRNYLYKAYTGSWLGGPRGAPGVLPVPPNYFWNLFPFLPCSNRL
jgi:hypothetical protein